VTRLGTLRAEMERRNLAWVFVSNVFNVRYLSGFSGSTAGLVVGPEVASLITDFRYEEQAAKEAYPGVKVVIDKRDVLAATCEMLSTVDGKVGFEGQTLAYTAFEKLAGAVRAELLPTQGLVEGQRKIKDQNEIASMYKAAQAADAVFGQIRSEIEPGMSETGLAARIDFLLRQKSTDVPPFKTIVASGERASLPHAQPTDKKLARGDLLTMDFGGSIDGYCSDLTRTVVIGKASAKQREVYQIVLDANLKALAGIKAGTKGNEADTLARQHIEARGYGERFGHSLGHGVGLEVHEEPRLSQKNTEPLESGMVATVEPGIYIPGWGGVRIEDLVVIEDQGCRLLSAAPKELVEIGA
jgi:Xaa-Pro aminopeptidase